MQHLMSACQWRQMHHRGIQCIQATHLMVLMQWLVPVLYRLEALTMNLTCSPPVPKVLLLLLQQQQVLALFIGFVYAACVLNLNILEFTQLKIKGHMVNISKGWHNTSPSRNFTKRCISSFWHLITLSHCFVRLKYAPCKVHVAAHLLVYLLNAIYGPHVFLLNLNCARSYCF